MFKKIVLFALCALVITGCAEVTSENGTQDTTASYADPCVVTLYSGGQLIGEWVSKGKVNTSAGEAWFKDRGTGMAITVSGSFIAKTASQYEIDAYMENHRFPEVTEASYADPCKVDFYSEGTLVNSWESAGKVSTSKGEAWFKDKETGNAITIGGTYVTTCGPRS